MESLISDELRAEYGDDDLVLLPSKKQKRAKTDLTPPPPKTLSKGARKRLAKLAKTKADRVSRAHLLRSISSSTLSCHDLRLLHSSGRLGQHDTRRMLARRDLHIDRSRLPLPSHASHLVEQDCSDSVGSAAPIPDPAARLAKLPATSVIFVSDRPRRQRRVVVLDRTVPGGAPPVVQAPAIAVSVEPIREKVPAILPEKTTAATPCVPNEARFVGVGRAVEVEAMRRQLPVYMEEQAIMEAVGSHEAVLVSGATGSGKTTQIPQFLYEAGFGSLVGRSGMIGVTQPRRVAAVAMAERVGKELGNHGHRVAHQIRFESRVGPTTAIKFMTDGILLREIQADFLLHRYSVIIIDEAHERNLNTDVLIGLLSRIIPLRRRLHPDSPLRLIIMSATMRIADFAANRRLFSESPPPIVSIDARQHPVTIRFSKTTSPDYVAVVVDKVSRIHRLLPPGGILVFVTGKQDIGIIVRKLRQRFSPYAAVVVDANFDHDRIWESGHDQIDHDVDLLDDRRADDDDDDEEKNSDLEWNSDMDGEKRQGPAPPCHILPLHALLSPCDQMAVFAPLPSPDHRLIVIATNVAETSLTLPGIKYVVDSGREKRRLYDPASGLSSLSVSWISKASAEQRAGRAGRTGPGHVYRLYSSAVYDHEFSDESVPEIDQAPIDATVLALKAMAIDDIGTFPFPTPPSDQALRAALQLLTRLGALQPHSPHSITNVGRAMAVLPLAPRYARMMAIADQESCRPYLIAIVSALTIDQIFLPNSQDEEEAPKTSYRAARQRWLDPTSDALSWMAVVLAFEFSADPPGFCHENHLRLRAMLETGRLRRQLHERISKSPYESCLPPPSSSQRSLLRQMVSAGFCDQIARRHPTIPDAYECAAVPDPVFLHPDSCLFSRDHHPDLVAYRDLIRGRSKMLIRGLTSVASREIYPLSPQLCRLSPKPLEDPNPVYCHEKDLLLCWHSCTYGPGRWPLPNIQLPSSPSKFQQRWFARLLLQGDIFPSWIALRPLLAYRPSACTALEAPTIPIAIFVSKLNLVSGRLLLGKWETDPSFLRAETRSLVQRAARDSFDALWPSLLK